MVAWGDTVHGCMVYTERAETAAVASGTSHVSALKYTTSVDNQKRAIKTSHSYRITCERSESAGERRIALYKSDQQQQQMNSKHVKIADATSPATD